MAAPSLAALPRWAHFFTFSTHDRCRLDDPDALLTDPVWWTAKAGYDNPRKLFLDECPKCHQLIDPSNEPQVIVNSDPRVVLAPASTPLDDFPPDGEPVYAHAACPGLQRQT